MSRCIVDILNNILNEIPDEPDTKPFFNATNKFLDNMIYVPPEMLFDTSHYIRFSEILRFHFGDVVPTEGWKKTVVDIWMNTNSINN